MPYRNPDGSITTADDQNERLRSISGFRKNEESKKNETHQRIESQVKELIKVGKSQLESTNRAINALTEYLKEQKTSEVIEGTRQSLQSTTKLMNEEKMNNSSSKSNVEVDKIVKTINNSLKNLSSTAKGGSGISKSLARIEKFANIIATKLSSDSQLKDLIKSVSSGKIKNGGDFAKKFGMNNEETELSSKILNPVIDKIKIESDKKTQEIVIQNQKEDQKEQASGDSIKTSEGTTYEDAIRQQEIDSELNETEKESNDVIKEIRDILLNRFKKEASSEIWSSDKQKKENGDEDKKEPNDKGFFGTLYDYWKKVPAPVRVAVEAKAATVAAERIVPNTAKRLMKSTGAQMLGSTLKTGLGFYETTQLMKSVSQNADKWAEYQRLITEGGMSQDEALASMFDLSKPDHLPKIMSDLESVTGRQLSRPEVELLSFADKYRVFDKGLPDILTNEAQTWGLKNSIKFAAHTPQMYRALKAGNGIKDAYQIYRHGRNLKRARDIHKTMKAFRISKKLWDSSKAVRAATKYGPQILWAIATDLSIEAAFQIGENILLNEEVDQNNELANDSVFRAAATVSKEDIETLKSLGEKRNSGRFEEITDHETLTAYKIAALKKFILLSQAVYKKFNDIFDIRHEEVQKPIVDPKEHPIQYAFIYSGPGAIPTPGVVHVQRQVGSRIVRAVTGDQSCNEIRNYITNLVSMFRSMVMSATSMEEVDKLLKEYKKKLFDGTKEQIDKFHLPANLGTVKENFIPEAKDLGFDLMYGEGSHKTELGRHLMRMEDAVDSGSLSPIDSKKPISLENSSVDQNQINTKAFMDAFGGDISYEDAKRLGFEGLGHGLKPKLKKGRYYYIDTPGLGKGKGIIFRKNEDGSIDKIGLFTRQQASEILGGYFNEENGLDGQQSDDGIVLEPQQAKEQTVPQTQSPSTDGGVQTSSENGSSTRTPSTVNNTNVVSVTNDQDRTVDLKFNEY